MSRDAGRWLFVSLTLFLSLCARPAAYAQTPADIERAKASFRAGAAAYAAGEYPAAIQALEAAYELTPLSAIAFSLAQAERRQYFVARERAHLERAIALFRRYVSEVPSGGRSADALDALSQLEPLSLGQPTGKAGTSSRPSLPLATPSVPVSTSPTRLMITSDAPGARVSLNGGRPVPAPLIHEVAPGQHRVLVEAEGFFPNERGVTALPGELILSEVALRERPGTLLVASPPEAELYVDGIFVSHGGPRTTLALPSGPHSLTVAQLGRRSAHRALVLRRGETVRIEVELASTLQRKFARSLFVAGGAALASGMVLGVLAYRNQGQALDFLAKQKRVNVSAGELDDYREAARHRDRYRVAAGLSLSTAATLFVCALLMHELDRPSTAETQRLGDPDTTPAPLSRLHVTPQLNLAPHGLAHAGAALSLSF